MSRIILKKLSEFRERLIPAAFFALVLFLPIRTFSFNHPLITPYPVAIDEYGNVVAENYDILDEKNNSNDYPLRADRPLTFYGMSAGSTAHGATAIPKSAASVFGGMYYDGVSAGNPIYYTEHSTLDGYQGFSVTGGRAIVPGEIKKSAVVEEPRKETIALKKEPTKAVILKKVENTADDCPPEAEVSAVPTDKAEIEISKEPEVKETYGAYLARRTKMFWKELFSH